MLINGKMEREQMPKDNFDLEIDVINGASKTGAEKIPNNGQTQNGKNIDNGEFAVRLKPQDDYELVPPDGGWGWVVLAGALLSNFLISGSIKSSGVLLVEFRELFHSSPSVSSGMVALCYFLYSCLAPVTSILSGRWSYRTLVIVGASFASTGMILSSFATSIKYLYVSFGVMLGIGAGLSVPCAIFIVPTYFVRFRGLANGICMSGSVFGSIILPPMILYLVENYGCKGAVLIQGGIILNALAAGMLLQPVKKHLVKKYKKSKDEEDHFQNEDKDVRNVPITRLKSTDEKIGNDKFGLSKKISEKSQIISSNTTNGFSLSDKRQNSSMKRTPEHVNDRRSSLGVPKHNAAASRLAHTSTSFCESELNNMDETGTHRCIVSKNLTTNDEDKMVTCCFCFTIKEEEKKKHTKKFDITIMKNPIFLIILVSSCVIPISYTNFVILLPSYVQNIGFSKARGAYLLSTVCTLELAGRLGGSAICDLKLVPPAIYFAGGLFFAGLSQTIIPFLDSYLAISFICALFGLSTGISTGAQTLVMTEVLGLEKLTSSYGITIFFCGILQLVGPPICGVWFEHDKNFFSMFLTFGIVYITGAASWLLLPMLKKREKVQAKTKGESLQKA